MSGINRMSDLPLELERQIFDECDIAMLLALRGVCTRYYHEVDRILGVLLYDILGRWFPDVPRFLGLLRRGRALVCGYAGLAYVLRDMSVLTNTLEVSVPADQEDMLREELLNAYGLVYFGTSAPFEEADFLDSVISHHYWHCGSRFLVLHCSPDRSAITPICREPNTALINFVGPLGFGCAYPALTLRRVGLTASWRILGDSDRRRNLTTVAKGNFRLSQEPCCLFPPSVSATVSSPPWPIPTQRRCFSELFACPRQARYFGDGGSLVDFFDIIRADLDTARREHLPPFGTTTVWRMLSTRPPCHRNCGGGDHLLLGGVMGAAVIVPAAPFHYGPRFEGIRAMY